MKVYNCLASWVQFGSFPVHELSQSAIVQAPFHTLVIPYPIPIPITLRTHCHQSLLDVPTLLYDAATDCICSMLYVCEDVQAYFPLANVLKSNVEQLRPQFQAAVQTEDQDR